LRKRVSKGLTEVWNGIQLTRICTNDNNNNPNNIGTTTDTHVDFDNVRERSTAAADPNLKSETFSTKIGRVLYSKSRILNSNVFFSVD
jgi:hypothetical protein